MPSLWLIEDRRSSFDPSTMQGAQIVWDGFLLALAEKCPNFVEVFVECAISLHAASSGVQQEALQWWVLHVADSKEWTRLKPGLRSLMLGACALNPTRRGLAQGILKSADAEVHSTWRDVLEASYVD